MENSNLTDALLHPTPDRLEAFVEGTLSDGDRAVIESHLLGCSRCESEVEEWQALFAMLSDLPSFAPAPGFADRVMAGVQLEKPWYARVAAAVTRVLPRTTRGWVVVGTFLTIPGVAIFAVAAWLLAMPAVTRAGILLTLQEQAGAALTSVATSVGSFLLKSEASLWLGKAVQAAFEPGAIEFGGVCAAFAVGTVMSGYVLYRNLIKSSTRGTRYVSYSF
jgi:anti-sigma factor RsiW